MALRLTPKLLSVHQQSEGRPSGCFSFQRRNGSGFSKSETEQAEEFNGQFTDVFSKTSENEVPLLEKSALPMSDIHVSNGVIKMMKGLNPSKALFVLKFYCPVNPVGHVEGGQFT